MYEKMKNIGKKALGMDEYATLDDLTGVYSDGVLEVIGEEIDKIQNINFKYSDEYEEGNPRLVSEYVQKMGSSDLEKTINTLDDESARKVVGSISYQDVYQDSINSTRNMDKEIDSTFGTKSPLREQALQTLKKYNGRVGRLIAKDMIGVNSRNPKQYFETMGQNSVVEFINGYENQTGENGLSESVQIASILAETHPDKIEKYLGIWMECEGECEGIDLNDIATPFYGLIRDSRVGGDSTEIEAFFGLIGKLVNTKENCT